MVENNDIGPWQHEGPEFEMSQYLPPEIYGIMATTGVAREGESLSDYYLRVYGEQTYATAEQRAIEAARVGIVEAPAPLVTTERAGMTETEMHPLSIDYQGGLIPGATPLAADATFDPSKLKGPGDFPSLHEWGEYAQGLKAWGVAEWTGTEYVSLLPEKKDDAGLMILVAAVALMAL
jgi:hypothetical protein